MDDVSILFAGESHNAGSWLTIRGLDGKKTSMRVKLAGVYSDAFRTVEKTRKAEEMIYSRLLQKDQGAASEYLETCMKDSEALAAVTLEWEGCPDPRPGDNYGKELECSKENAAMIYDCGPNIFDQCNVYFSNSENFMKGSQS